MRYAISRFESYQSDMAYRFYISDELYYSGRNKTHTNTFRELMNPKLMDNRSGDEIAEDVIKRAGLVVKE